MTVHELPSTDRPPAESRAGAARSVRDLLVELRHEPDASSQRSHTFGTGFEPLDTALSGGIRTNDLVLVGGAPGVGKTIATLQWARHMAREGRTAIYACYEHDEATLLARLLTLELGEQRQAGAAVHEEVRRAVALGGRRLWDAVRDEPALRAAHESLQSYAERLWLVKVSGSRTTVDQLAALVGQHGDGQTVLFVDYLQKVPVRPEPAQESEKVLRIAEGLKDLALALGIAVVSVAAADQSGLEQRRLRLRNLRGSSALAYESDLVLLLNDKVNAVSKVHLAYDTVKAATYQHQVVFSIEKHRAGQANLDLEFRKDFAHYRFEPNGAFVAERLADERLELE